MLYDIINFMLVLPYALSMAKISYISLNGYVNQPRTRATLGPHGATIKLIFFRRIVQLNPE